MSEKNAMKNNFLTQQDRERIKENKEKKKSKEKSKEKKDNTTLLYQAYSQLKAKIVADKGIYLNKIINCKFLLTSEEDKELYKKIEQKIISDFEEIMKELEATYKNYKEHEIDEEQFESFLFYNGDGNGFEDRIKKIKEPLDTLVEQILQKDKYRRLKIMEDTKGGVPEDPQKPDKKKAKMETRGDYDSRYGEIDFEDIDMMGDCEVNKTEQTEEEIELLHDKLEYPKENKNENEKENKKCELRRANHVDETLNKGSFFTKDWKDRSTGEKIGFVLMNIGLGIITAGIFNAILFGVVRNDSACCSKEVINEIEEDRKSIK